MSVEQLEAGYIPSKLDVPPKILWWEVDTVVVFAVPLWFFGLILKEYVLALLCAFLLSYFFKKVKTSNHPKFLKHFLYWYLPSGIGGIKLKSLPISSVRYFLS
jgi:conjugal transfer pilus assembly protein TraL